MPTPTISSITESETDNLPVNAHSLTAPLACSSPPSGLAYQAGADDTGRWSSHSAPEDFEVDALLPIKTSIAILGAGPAGLMTALLLAKQGVDFVLIDHNRVEYPDDPPPEMIASLPTQGIILTAESLDILQQVGLLEKATLMGRPLQGGSVLLHGQVLRKVSRYELNETTKFQSGIILEQWKLERILCDALRLMGVKIYRHHVAYRMVIKIGEKSTLPDEGASSSAADDNAHASNSTFSSMNRLALTGDYRVKIFVKRMEPIARRPNLKSQGKWLYAKYVVGADGVRSMTRRALEIDMTSIAPLYEYLVADFKIAQWSNDILAQSHRRASANTSPQVPGDNHLFVVHSINGSGVFIPYARSGYWRLIVRRDAAIPAPGASPAHPSGFGRLQPASEEDLMDIVASLVPGSQVESFQWRAAYATDTRLANQMVRERGILIGDAARYTPPTWSAGINAAIHDAYALSWRLAAVVSGNAIAGLLETFEEEQMGRSKAMMIHGATFKDALLDYSLISQFAKSNILDLVARRDFKTVDKGLMSVALLPSEFASLKSEADIGVSLSAARVLGFSANEDTVPKSMNLLQLTGGTSHVLLLLFRLLPAGTRQKTLFGCEREELAARYSKKDLDELVSLARSVEPVFLNEQLTSSNPTRFMSCASQADSQLPVRYKPVFVLCGLVDTTTIRTNQALKGPSQLLREIPAALKAYMVHGSGLKGCVYTVIDHECQIQRRTGFNLDPSDEWLGALMQKAMCRDESTSPQTAFVLMRPDGKVAAMGHPGGSKSRGALDDYLRHFFNADLV